MALHFVMDVLPLLFKMLTFMGAAGIDDEQVGHPLKHSSSQFLRMVRCPSVNCSCGTPIAGVLGGNDMSGVVFLPLLRWKLRGYKSLNTFCKRVHGGTCSIYPLCFLVLLVLLGATIKSVLECTQLSVSCPSTKNYNCLHIYPMV